MRRRRMQTDDYGEQDDIEIPKDPRYEYKYTVLLGRKVFAFESEEEGTLFLNLIQLKHVPVEDALKMMEEMKKKALEAQDEEPDEYGEDDY